MAIPGSRPPTQRAVLLALAVGFAGGLLVWFYYTRYAPGVWSDFDQVWLGARALLSGRDPYTEVPKNFPWPLYYPLPALVLGLPFAPWSLLVGRVLFAAVTSGVANWAIFRYRPQAWPLMLSAPFAYSLIRGQWAPLLVAGALVPTAQLLQNGVHRFFWPPMLVFGYLPVLACVLWPSPLRERPAAYVRWPVWRQTIYGIVWTSVLALVGLSALLWTYLVWSRT